MTAGWAVTIDPVEIEQLHFQFLPFKGGVSCAQQIAGEKQKPQWRGSPPKCGLNLSVHVLLSMMSGAGVCDLQTYRLQWACFGYVWRTDVLLFMLLMFCPMFLSVLLRGPLCSWLLADVYQYMGYSSKTVFLCACSCF